jgi:uncharacterized membrane protein
MTIVPVAALYDWILGVHIIAVVVAFGWTFTLPLVYSVAARQDPRSLPLLHRIEFLISRFIANPALAVIVAAGIYLASEGHHWSEFFVQWGIGVAIVVGGLLGSVLMPGAKKAEQAARRDLESYSGGEFTPSAEYAAITRRLNVVGSLASGLVVLTILFMVVKP